MNPLGQGHLAVLSHRLQGGGGVPFSFCLLSLMRALLAARAPGLGHYIPNSESQGSYLLNN